MKKLILLMTVVSVTASLFAQKNTSFFDKQLLGKGIEPSSMQISVDAYPFLFLSKGGGGSVGLETGNWQAGIYKKYFF
jgi:hypothetical protein